MPEPPSSQRNTVAVPYRGHDRRALMAPHQSPTGRPFFVAGFGLALLTALVVALDTPSDGLQSVAASFELSAGVLGIVAATLGVVRWRLAGDARALWIGTAVGMYSVFSVALVQLLPALYTGEFWSKDWIGPASLVVTLAVFAVALQSPEIDARLQPFTTFGLALAGLAAIALVILVAEPIRLWLVDEADAHRPVVSSVIALAWAGFATVYTLRGMRDGRLLFAWYGLTMFGLTLAELTSALLVDAADPELLVPGSAIIRCISLLYAVVGVTQELQLLFASQSSRLLNTVVDTLSSHASLRAAQERQEELAHEARNALTAIEGATQTLERFREKLDDETRRALALAVSDEISRLQRMVSASQQTNHPVSFRLSDIVRPQIDLVRAQGAQVDALVSDDLIAFGRPADFAEVLQNLLVNAQLHGRNPITVRAANTNDHIILRVEDRGPGVPVAIRAAIFQRGRRASDAPGSGLGLYVSRQLMKEQDGNVWVEDRPGGGASFVIAIPAGPKAAALSFTDSGRLQRVVKNRHNGGKAANGYRPLDGSGTQRPQAGSRTRLRKPEQPVD